MKKYKSQGKAVEVIVNSKEENFCLDFVQEFGLWKVLKELIPLIVLKELRAIGHVK